MDRNRQNFTEMDLNGPNCTEIDRNKPKTDQDIPEF